MNSTNTQIEILRTIYENQGDASLVDAKKKIAAKK